jgi:hypothetical protein
VTATIVEDTESSIFFPRVELVGVVVVVDATDLLGGVVVEVVATQPTAESSIRAEFRRKNASTVSVNLLNSTHVNKKTTKVLDLVFRWLRLKQVSVILAVGWSREEAELAELIGRESFHQKVNKHRRIVVGCYVVTGRISFDSKKCQDWHLQNSTCSHRHRQCNC